jgi:hypothetical protein
MKTTKASSLLNKSIHRHDKAERSSALTREAFLRGDFAAASRHRRRSFAYRQWSDRYLKALDSECFTEFPPLY